MHGHEVQGWFDEEGEDRSVNDHGLVVIGLLAAAISGFLMGLATRGEIACVAIMALLAPAAGIAGWRLRAAFARGERQTE